MVELSAAFDTVDYAILLNRLHTHFGISRHAPCSSPTGPTDSNPYLFTAEYRRGLRQSMVFHKDLVLVPSYSSSMQASCS